MVELQWSSSMTNSYILIKDFMKKYPMTIAWRTKQKSKIIDKHLNHKEKILYIFNSKNISKNQLFNNLLNNK